MFSGELLVIHNPIETVLASALNFKQHLQIYVCCGMYTSININKQFMIF